MEMSIIKTFGQFAGIGGLGLVVFYFLLKNIMKILNVKQSDKENGHDTGLIIMTALFLITFITVVAIFAWMYTSTLNSDTKSKNKKPVAEIILAKPLNKINPEVNTPNESKLSHIGVIPNSNFSGVERFDTTTILDTSYLDLRNIKNVPPNEVIKYRISPAKLVNYVEFIKNRDDVTNVNIPYATDGAPIEIRCLTHNGKQFTKNERHKHHDRDFITSYVDVDVSQEEVSKNITMINEVTYWNQFRLKKEFFANWVDITQKQPEQMTFIIYFPKERPYIRYSLFSYPEHNDVHKELAKKDYISNTDTNNRTYIYINIPKAMPGYTYEVEWEW